MLNTLLQSKTVILGSQSPRRKELLAAMDVDFQVEVRTVDESFPPGLAPAAVAEYIAKSKAEAFLKDLQPDHIIITGDTVVVNEKEILGKPGDDQEAYAMLRNLSGKKHEVISSLGILTHQGLSTTSDTAHVYFKHFTEAELDYYITTYKPFDKAGAYGIQEWLGHIGLLKLEGSYNTVMGLPTHLLYQVINTMI